jgi:predicted HicB family RNase H-like nuclease
MEKAQAIVAVQDYDTRISVPVDFTDEEILRYAKLAHEKDITLNQFIEQALREFLEHHKLPTDD